MSTKSLLAVFIAIVGVTVYQASNWWERAYATYESSELSPDGCIRVDTYQPFWVLPSIFHRIPEPDSSDHYRLGMTWDEAIFKRAYEASTGSFLGETIVYHPFGQEFVDWGDRRKPGRRIVSSNGFPLVDSSRCSDESTMARLNAFYDQKMGITQPAVNGVDGDQNVGAHAGAKSSVRSAPIP